MVTSTYLFEHSSEGSFLQVVVFDMLKELFPNSYSVFSLKKKKYIYINIDAYVTYICIYIQRGEQYLANNSHLSETKQDMKERRLVIIITHKMCIF